MNIFSALKAFPKLLVLIAITVIIPLIAFLIIGPNISKPVYAASCRVNTTIPVPEGFTINVGTDGVDTTLATQLVLNPGANKLGPIKVSSVSGPTAADYKLTVPAGTYNAVVVVGPFFILCGGGTDGSGGVQVTAAPPPPASCQYTYPSSVAPGGTLSVTITGNTGNGTYAAGIANQDGTAISAANGGPVRVTKTGSPTITIDVPIPSQLPAGQYLVVATKDPTPQCGGDPSLSLTVTPPPPPPTTNTCTDPGNGMYVLGNNPTISGNTATFTITSGSAQVPISSSQNVILHVIYQPDTGQTAGQDSPVSGSGVSWAAPQNGNYCAALVYITTQISNAVPFTIGTTTGTGDSCSAPKKVWSNTMYCDAIAKNYFDSGVFTVGQSAGVIDFLNIIISGHSLNIPQINQIATTKGALALTGNAVASLYGAPPASGVVYFAQKIHDLNPVQPAYAQTQGGIGYQTLGPVQKIWVAFRNVAYVGFILVFVIIGFMIMFRAHISPQTVATVQDSVPRLIIALILVTFSYAIAGFMIDIMFLVLNIAVGALVQAKLITGADYIFKQNVFQVIWGSWTDTFAVVAKAMSTLIGNVISLPGFIGSLFEWAGGSLVAVVIGIAILFIMFRIFLMLLMAYVMIIILTMFAPFFFLIQALPGNNGAKEWFKQMASNIAVFPTVALMFILAGILGGIDKLAPGASTPAIQPGQIGQFPLIIGNLDATAIGQLIGIGFLLITPSAAEIVKNAFGGKGQGGGLGNFGAAAMAGVAAGAGVVGAGARWGWSGGGPIADWRKAQAAGRENYRGLLGREYANRKWETKNPGKARPGI